MLLFRDTVLLGGGFFKRDIHLAWLPQIEAFVRAVAVGAWPVWDPSPAFGQPLLADPGAQILYPYAWLNLVLKPWVYYPWFAATHCLFSTTCLFLLARRWGFSRLGALTAAVLWLVSGPYISMVDLWHHFASASWMPAVVLAFDRAAERPRTASFLTAGMTLAGQVLAGSADLTVITLAVAFANVALIGWAGRSRTSGGGWSGGVRASRPLLSGLALALAVAAGLTACLWLPAADVASRSSRAGLPAAERTYWSVHPLGLLDTLLPGLWNVPQLSERLGKALFEGREPFLDTLYLGLPALALVGLGTRRPHPRRALLVACLAFFTLVSLGRHTPFYEWLVGAITPLQIFRFPVKVTVAVGFAWSLLAGLGCDRLRALDPGEASRSLRVPLRLVEVGAAVSLVWAAAIALLPETMAALLLDRDGSASARELLTPLAGRLALAGTAALVVLLAPRLTKDAKGCAILCAALAMGELVVQHRDPNPVAPVGFFTYRPEVLRLLGPPSTTRVYVYDYFDPAERNRLLGRPYVYPARVPPAGWSEDAASALTLQGGLVPETAGRWGLRQAYDLNYRGLFPKLLVELGRALRDIDGTPVHTRWLRLGGVTHVIALHRQGLDALPLTGTVLTPLPLYVFAVPGTLPRAYAVTGVRVAQGVDTFRILADPRFALRSEVVLPPGAARVRPPGPPGSARFLDDRPDRVVIETDMQEAGHLVLLDTYDPGWHATVDGRPSRVLAANAIFRAVAVPAGRHVVEMVYRPRALLVGLTVTATTVAALGLLFYLLRRRPPLLGSS